MLLDTSIVATVSVLLLTKVICTDAIFADSFQAVPRITSVFHSLDDIG